MVMGGTSFCYFYVSATDEKKEFLYRTDKRV